MRIKAEATVCTRKYFKAASVWYLFFFLIIIGVKAIMFTSSAIHTINQEWVEIIVRIDKIMVNINKIFEGWRNINYMVYTV